jgi:ADP-dependent phosphofructokinase/glucokinase
MQMPTQQQITLDDLLSMLMARVDAMSMAEENLKTKMNILGRVLYKKGILTDEDVMDSIREEHRLLKELGAIEKMPSEEMVKLSAEGILQWIRGDAEAIKKGMEEYEKKVRDLAAQEARKPRIDVASASVLDQLDHMTGKKPGGSKLIL